MKKTPIFLSLLLLMSLVVFAQPPFQESTSADELTVIFPKGEAVKKDRTGIIHFHVFNSTGYLVPADETTCNIHIYNPSDVHVLQSNLTANVNNIDLEVNINATVTGETGVYSFIVWCNSTNEAGFISGFFAVTNSGVLDEGAGEKWIAIVLLLIGFAFGLFFIANNIKSKALYDIKLLFFFYSVINIMFLGLSLLAITLNPHDVLSFQGVAIAYFSFTAIGLILFIWLYGKHLIFNALQNKGGET